MLEVREHVAHKIASSLCPVQLGLEVVCLMYVARADLPSVLGTEIMGIYTVLWGAVQTCFSEHFEAKLCPASHLEGPVSSSCCQSGLQGGYCAGGVPGAPSIVGISAGCTLA